ncbi:hypothetical protein SAMN05421640_0316 [Ekhidna lutea]|uniref:ATP-grasp domain-containing protein n=1 Tax=Ekhidna lutea TaxID=447679 RepID=A0A239EVC5_EKHLU|nr:hypothetical protein SAMN05421640_0316 [Ekhidna lutea]
MIRLKNWEYWPFSILYFPVFFYFGWLALKHRSFFFFTASNPSIEFGGMFGEKKSDIFELIPDEWIPETKLVSKGDLERASYLGEQIGFPLIAKPDIGERGIWVSKLYNQQDLQKYVRGCPVDFLLQELIDLPLELGVFFVKYPGEKGQVSSIVRKSFMTVTGDGKTTIRVLLEKDERALMTTDLESDHMKLIGSNIPKMGEKVLIEPIGNHCRGTKFLNDNHEIDEALNAVFNNISDRIPDFYFGRYDLKCKSYEDLRELKNFKILELNGAGAEPGHIYQPGYSLMQAYRDILWHLRVLSDICRLNRKMGHSYWSFKQGFKKWKAHQEYNRLLGKS